MGDESLTKIDRIFSKYNEDLEMEQRGISKEEEKYAFFRIEFDTMAKEFITPIFVKLGERLQTYGAKYEIIELPPEPHDGIKKMKGISLRIHSMPLNDHLELIINTPPCPSREVIVTQILGGNPMKDSIDIPLDQLTSTVIENLVIELVEKSFVKRPGL